MFRSWSIRVSLLAVSFVLMPYTVGQAAPVIWTIDTALTVMGMQATGRMPLGTSGLASLKIIQQGLTPALQSITPTVSARISGRLLTDTDFTSTITFLSLSNGMIEGETTGNWTPDTTGLVDAKVPGDIGASALVKLGPINRTVADAVLRDLRYDLSSSGAAISGGSFSTTNLIFAIDQGHLDYRGFNDLGTQLGSGSTSIADRTNGGLNSAGNAKITITGTKATLTMPISATMNLLLSDGDNSDSTSDDLSVDLTFVGNIVAHTSTVPEPSALALTWIGALALGGEGIRRHYRRLST